VLNFFYDSYAVLLSDVLFCSIPISMREGNHPAYVYTMTFGLWYNQGAISLREGIILQPMYIFGISVLERKLDALYMCRQVHPKIVLHRVAVTVTRVVVA
jgi:hypothetical protein